MIPIQYDLLVAIDISSTESEKSCVYFYFDRNIVLHIGLYEEQ